MVKRLCGRVLKWLLPKYSVLFFQALDADSKYFFSRNPPYRCPVCNFPASKFHDMYGNLKNRCVRCRSASRERAEALYFKQSGLVEEWQHQKLLHFAPELGMYFFLKKNLKEYVCCDIDPSQYPDREVEQQDILALTYGDETFDGILCNHVLEHIVDDKKAMQELFRVLKKGGKAILTVPIDDTLSKTKEDLSITDPEIRKREYWQEDHVRLYAKDGFIRRLQAVGFTAVAVRPTLREEEFHHYGVWTEVWIFVATK